ncbi:MAG TPA: hypothetical protein VF933_00285 [Streptosporangiaceae bacterium]
MDDATLRAVFDEQVRRHVRADAPAAHAERAGLAARRGYRYLTVDASADSEPILRRLGFRCLARTTPYQWAPAGDA